MNKKLIALVALLTPFICVGAPESVVIEKSSLKLADQIFNAQYIEYSEPVTYKNWTPVEGETPAWAKPGEITTEWYLYSFNEVTNCLSVATLKMSGLDSKESFDEAKKTHLESSKNAQPMIMERSLYSKLYLTNKNHEYLYVTFQMSSSSSKSSASTSAWLEKVNGKWIDVTCDTMSFKWVKALTALKVEAITSGANSDEWLKEFLSSEEKTVSKEKREN